MTKIVSNVVCPYCHTVSRQYSSQVLEEGDYTGMYHETWCCTGCDRKFDIVCERKLSYFYYANDEDGEGIDDGEDYVIDYEGW